MTFEERVTTFINDHHLIQPRMRLVAGVSGGADSMALLHFLSQKRDDWALVLAVCSVDHGLRGAAGRDDLNFVASFCRKNNIIFYGRTVDVRTYMKKRKMSMEAAARELRYQAFREVIEQFHADALVLAHHGDDQIETMLMRAVRGSAGMARSGIPVKRPFAGAMLIRPFLSQTKEALEAYCLAHGIKPRTDATNALDTHTRNRFRKYVLPFLKQENPSVHLKFQYESERIAEDERLLIQMAEERLKQIIIEKKKDQIKFSVPGLLRSAIPLQRRIIHLILNYLYTNQMMQPLHQSIHIENLLQFFRSGRASGNLYFPGGLIARKSYEFCMIGLPEPMEKGYDTVLHIPGKTLFAAGTIVAELLPEGNCIPESGCSPESLIINYGTVALPLRVRTWKPGDRLTPKGMKGSQKVQRIFINKKVPRDKRLIWPLITDGNGNILWMPFLRRGRQPAPKALEHKTKYLKLTFTSKVDLGRTEA
ncbi:tRNA lysidine(34) synthetase TilS [Sporolactobacillus sp. THM7-4]|nr:tRNA lysidine(34) synthetase TilS [Sporolactobacillus sp. THM7-4]